MPATWRRFYCIHLLLLAISGVALLLLFHLTNLDVRLEDAWHAAAGHAAVATPWPLRDAWWTSTLLHQWLRYVLHIAALACMWAAWVRRRQWDALRWRVVAFASLVVPLVVATGKRLSGMHCPWDIDRYGGYAPYYDLIAALTTPIAQPGHCFPAGFVSTGSWLLAFALFYYPANTRRSLWIGFAAAALSLGLGFVQQMRGAHFLSHVLWTLWLSWCIVLVLHMVLRAWRSPSQATASPQA
jgi:membrane-associated PAP2 superfamily phosphatase